MAWAHGSFYWNELMTWDVEQAKRFYAETLGWRYEAIEMPEWTYWDIKCGEALVGGIFGLSEPHFAGVPESWLAYIAVDDVDARLAKAAAAGGIVMRPAVDVPGVGRIGIIREPGGAGIGWITPAEG